MRQHEVPVRQHEVPVRFWSNAVPLLAQNKPLEEDAKRVIGSETREDGPMNLVASVPRINHDTG